MLTKMLNRMTANYDRRETSNLGRLIRIVSEEIEEVQDTVLRTELWRDLREARGKTLDRIGGNVQQYRGTATDEIYRILIRSKIARNQSTGDMNTILEILATALDSSPDEFEVEERPEDEPASIRFSDVDIEAINRAGMTSEQFVTLASQTVACGINVRTVMVIGTFQLADGDEVQTDDEAGFSDEDQEIGGYWSEVFAPGYDWDVPL